MTTLSACEYSFRHKRRSFLVFAAILVLAGCHEKPKPPAPNDSSSLRIMTMNCIFLPKIGDILDANAQFKNLSTKERVAIIAKGIRRADVDVVALQEVWTDEAKDAFEAELSAEFPYYVWELDGAGLDQDSGLMLFSRHPFVPLTNQAYLAKHYRAVSAGSLWSQVAFVEFSEPSLKTTNGTKNTDKFANKGAGLVRIQKGDVRFTVVFTHLQSDYGVDASEVGVKNVGIRASQLAEVANMTKSVLTPMELELEPVLFVGDLNVDGKGAPGPSAKSEWRHHFDALQAQQKKIWKFMTRGNSPFHWDSALADAWAYDWVPKDLGRTFGRSENLDSTNLALGERIDYVVWNRPRNYTIQHLRVMWEIADSDGKVSHRNLPDYYASDHLPVLVDLNLNHPHASPLAPLATSFPNSNPNFKYADSIGRPGEAQWLKIDQMGTYSIDVESGQEGFHAGFEVFVDTDLSRPMSQWHGEVTDWGKVFEIDHPAYIKVQAVDENGAPTRKTTGTFKLQIRQHRGTFPEDAIRLQALVPKSYSWPSAQMLNSEDTLWYRFMTDDADDGQLPRLGFHVDRSDTMVPFEIELGPANLPSKSLPFQAAPTWSSSATRLTGWAEKLAAPNGSEPYFLKVRRTNPLANPVDTTTVFETNLTFLEPMFLGCEDENDGPGIDEIWMRFRVDGQQDMKEVYLGKFDDHTDQEIKSSMKVRRYLSKVQPVIREEDDGANGDDDILSYHPNQPFEVGIPALGSQDPGNEKDGAPMGELFWANKTEIGPADYWYMMRYRRTHNPPLEE